MVLHRTSSISATDTVSYLGIYGTKRNERLAKPETPWLLLHRQPKQGLHSNKKTQTLAQPLYLR